MDHWKAQGAGPFPILVQPGTGAATRCVTTGPRLDKALDVHLIELCEPALEYRQPVRAQLPIRNVNRTVGTMLGSELTRRVGADGLPPGTIDITFTGSAGQSFGHSCPRGPLRLDGDTNDYLGKGLSGGP